ncbi:MAG: hypothetical protein HY820_01140 [Acidobacteria bacterium]|nr:hypothetical protein [Acidobacteriota bacterium]
MGFSDNLENNLKSLEAREELDPMQFLRERERKENERKEKLAAAPFAEKLRTCAFTQNLLGLTTRLGFSKRVKVHMVWVDSGLRLEARNLRLELRPTGKGIRAHFYTDGQETQSEMIDLEGDAQPLAERWLAGLE